MGLNGNKRPENEALFRAANERLKNQLRSLQEGGRIPFVCECSDADCMEVVDVPLATYEKVRTGPNQFMLRAGHDTPAHERVVALHDGYVVVEKQRLSRESGSATAGA